MYPRKEGQDSRSVVDSPTEAVHGNQCIDWLDRHYPLHPERIRQVCVEDLTSGRISMGRRHIPEYTIPFLHLRSPHRLEEPGDTQYSVPHFAAEVFGGMTRGQDSLTSHIQLRGARHDNYIVIDKFTSRGDAWSHHQSDLPIFRTVVVDRPTGRCCSFLFCCCYRRRRWCSSSCRSHMPSATNCNPVTNPAIVVWQ